MGVQRNIVRSWALEANGSENRFIRDRLGFAMVKPLLIINPKGFGLDAEFLTGDELCNGFHLKLVCIGDNGVHNINGPLIFGDQFYDTAVNFDIVRFDFQQVIKVGIPGTEIINGNFLRRHFLNLSMVFVALA